MNATDRELVAALMLRNGFATGHGDTLADLLVEFEWQIAERKIVAEVVGKDYDKLLTAWAECRQLLTDARKEVDTASATIERLRGTLEYILAQASQGYPTVLSVIKANAKAALDDAWQETYAKARSAIAARLTQGDGK